ncbi:class I SAM-dependent methyltransferase [Maioricimonas sp. JC845]|uniref:class I SAM-dependent methyltransferase n=1 Tax=Maioricimonas sp. JC845 TaxID=3232138 RepID=UPI0034589E79
MKSFLRQSTRWMLNRCYSAGWEIRRLSAPWPTGEADRGKVISGRDDVVADFVERYPFDTVLDVGCGRGSCFRGLASKGARVSGIDILPAAQVNTATGARPAEFMCGNVLDVEPNRQFDAVIASHVIEHMPDTERFLRRFFGWLRPGGAFCLIWPPPKSGVVGGHVHLFNHGLMLYHLVRIGIDCRTVRMVQAGYSLAVMGRHERFDVPPLIYDEGEIALLAEYFPFPVQENFDGSSPPGLVRLDGLEPTGNGH